MGAGLNQAPGNFVMESEDGERESGARKGELRGKAQGTT